MAHIYPLSVLLGSLTGLMIRHQAEIAEYLVEENEGSLLPRPGVCPSDLPARCSWLPSLDYFGCDSENDIATVAEGLVIAGSVSDAVLGLTYLGWTLEFMLRPFGLWTSRT
jgi:hypothetical protein